MIIFYDVYSGKSFIFDTKWSKDITGTYDEIWNAGEWYIGTSSGRNIIIKNLQWKIIKDTSFYWGDNSNHLVFTEGLMPMKDNNSDSEGYINTNGDWVIKPIYHQISAFSGWIANVRVDTSDWKSSWQKVDKDGSILTEDLNIEKILNYQFNSNWTVLNITTWEKYPRYIPGNGWVLIIDNDWHIMVLWHSWDLILPFWEYTLKSNNIDLTIAFDYSAVAIRKWNKWSPNWFNDFSYDRIIFGFMGHAEGFALIDGLALASKNNNQILLDTRVNKIIYSFPQNIRALNEYGTAEWFIQISKNILAVGWNNWSLIDRTWKKLLDWYEEISEILYPQVRNTTYLGIKEGWSDLIVIKDERVKTYPLGMTVKSIMYENWLYILYDKKGIYIDWKQEVKKIIWYMYPDGFIKKVNL